MAQCSGYEAGRMEQYTRGFSSVSLMEATSSGYGEAMEEIQSLYPRMISLDEVEAEGVSLVSEEQSEPTLKKQQFPEVLFDHDQVTRADVFLDREKQLREQFIEQQILTSLSKEREEESKRLKQRQREAAEKFRKEKEMERAEKERTSIPNPLLRVGTTQDQNTIASQQPNATPVHAQSSVTGVPRTNQLVPSSLKNNNWCSSTLKSNQSCSSYHGHGQNLNYGNQKSSPKSQSDWYQGSQSHYPRSYGSYGSNPSWYGRNQTPFSHLQKDLQMRTVKRVQQYDIRSSETVFRQKNWNEESSESVTNQLSSQSSEQIP